MKIIASKREDIIRQRDAWDTDYTRAKEQRHNEAQEYAAAVHAVSDPIKEEIESELSRFDKLSVVVTVNAWEIRRSKKPIIVRVQVNENKKFEDSSALSWEFQVQLDDDGNVLKETGSWSGLQATTREQLESLRQTLSALEYLNNVDWGRLLDKALPAEEDYMKTFLPDIRDRPNFEQQLMEVDLEDALGGDNAVKCYNWESSGLRGQYVWVQLIRETPSGYTGRVYYGSSTEDQVRAWLKRTVENDYSTQRIRKTTIKPVTPLTIVSVNDAESVSEE